MNHKTAIAISGNSMNATVDAHFGKCPYFLIVNVGSMKTEIHENPGRMIPDCKGAAIVSFLVLHKVTRVIAGDFGSTVQQLLNNYRIQMIIHPNDTIPVSEIVSQLNSQ